MWPPTNQMSAFGHLIMTVFLIIVLMLVFSRQPQVLSINQANIPLNVLFLAFVMFLAEDRYYEKFPLFIMS